MSFVSERFDARERSADFRRAIGADAFPPWLIWGDPDSDVWWERSWSSFPQFQIVLMPEEEGDPVASAWGVPIDWDGSVADLPEGYTDTLRRAVQGHERAVAPNALIVCAAVVLPGLARSGVAGELLQVMRDLPAAAHLAHVLVPIRPTLKSKYPLTPIEEFASWTRADGAPLDPWLRTHVRIGGEVIGFAPASQRFRGTVAQWEEWAQLTLPGSGDYVLAGALAPLHVDHEADQGTLVEPNVWIRHR